MSIYWSLLFLAIFISMVAQGLMKAGAQADTFLHQLFAWQTILGFALYATSSILYILALRRIPMSVALPCTAVSYVAAALIGHFIFGETLTPQRIGAIGLILGGVVLLVI